MNSKKPLIEHFSNLEKMKLHVFLSNRILWKLPFSLESSKLELLTNIVLIKSESMKIRTNKVKKTTYYGHARLYQIAFD